MRRGKRGTRLRAVPVFTYNRDGLVEGNNPNRLPQRSIGEPKTDFRITVQFPEKRTTNTQVRKTGPGSPCSPLEPIHFIHSLRHVRPNTNAWRKKCIATGIIPENHSRAGKKRKGCNKCGHTGMAGAVFFNRTATTDSIGFEL